ncbi:hypothetical protein RclHR1_10450005 [Rhizophagus clarus]|nr:hypothetical protein RclHR1_10450005 [Rhizophagus clarus]
MAVQFTIDVVKVHQVVAELLYTGQICSIYKDIEIIGLSIYNYMLKVSAFKNRSLITAEQKYKLVYDMAKNFKAFHVVGFAHHDLYEENMMVNNTSDKLTDGSIKSELAFGKTEFINHDDVST